MNNIKKNSVVKRNIIISGIISFLLVVILGITILKTFVYPLKYEDIVLTNSNKYNLDPYLVFAVINVESNFKKMALSSRNAKGLMQMTESTAQEMNEMTNTTDYITEESLYNENINIELGCKYLSDLIARYNGNYYLAVCAYNAGIGNVNSWIEDGKMSETLDTTDISLPFLETTNYLKKVISNYEVYKTLYPQIS